MHNNDAPSQICPMLHNFSYGPSIRRVDAERKFHSLLYLDVPTYNASTQIIPLSRLGIQCEIVEISMNIAMTVVRLLSQLLVLMTVLREQQDGLLLAILSLSQPIFNWNGTQKAVARSSSKSTVDVPRICLSCMSLGCNNHQ
ncbi:hypothetical protein C8R48DRAFT_430634 [Suillus tomentosus]|nr:hypothetical protein C8R48DRAFT_430634 [Suillus tomentosus]